MLAIRDYRLNQPCEQFALLGRTGSGQICDMFQTGILDKTLRIKYPICGGTQNTQQAVQGIDAWIFLSEFNGRQMPQAYIRMFCHPFSGQAPLFSQISQNISKLITTWLCFLDTISSPPPHIVGWDIKRWNVPKVVIFLN